MTTAQKTGGGTVVPSSPKEKCPHCNGPVEVVGKGRGNVEIRRCRSCGREPSTGIIGEPRNGTSSSAPEPKKFIDVAPGSALRPCRVDGCPGILDAAGKCACCEKRAVWVLENTPIRSCRMCEGPIQGRKNREYCEACKRARNSVAAVKTKTAQKAGSSH
jgi:hypothetical protein